MARLALLAALVLVPVAPRLKSQEPRYYRGSVVKDGEAAPPASLELAIWKRGGTAFLGWLRVGPPLAWSGYAYGGSEGADSAGSLLMLTASATGDSIEWRSLTRHGEIGGRYVVRRGPASGQGGTWRLVPAAEPPWTLRLVLTTGAGLTVVGVLIVIARRRAYRWWRRVQSPVVTAGRRAALTGLGGWLGVFLFLNGVSVLILALQLSGMGDMLGGTVWLMGATVPSARAFAVIEAAAHVTQLGGVSAGIILTVRRRPEAPTFWVSFFAVLVLFAALDEFIYWRTRLEFAEYVGLDAAKRYAVMADEHFANAIAIGYAAVWARYWSWGERVWFTFAPTAPAGLAAAPPSPR
jgi:hypothetical protein